MGVPFGKVDKAYIDRLIADKESESRTLEYKESLPQKTGDGKKDLLADVTAMANAHGGLILFGITEERTPDRKKTGRPKSAIGLEAIAADEEIRWLEQVIRANVDPRIRGIQIKAIPGFVKGSVIALSTLRSHIGPHMIILGLEGRQNPYFYMRTSAGNHRLDVGEIRAAFALAEDLPQAISSFRVDRAALILSGETPAQLQQMAILLIHVIPFGAMDKSAVTDIVRQIESQHFNDISPICNTRATSHRYNFDGFLQTSSPSGYVQVFRNGIIEIADCCMLAEYRKQEEIGRSNNLIYGPMLEFEVIEAVKRSLTFLEHMEIPSPYAIGISLFDVGGYAVVSDVTRFIGENHIIDRTNLFIPMVIVEDSPKDNDVALLLKPAFDILWQASNWPQSKSYLDGQFNYSNMTVGFNSPHRRRE